MNMLGGHFSARIRHVRIMLPGRVNGSMSEYIRNQIQDDQAYDQLSLKEYIDPFTGEPANKGNK